MKMDSVAYTANILTFTQKLPARHHEASKQASKRLTIAYKAYKE